MKKILTLLALAALFITTANAQEPAADAQQPQSTEGVAPAPITLSSSFDFGKYTIASPAGMLAQTANNQIQAFLPSGNYTMIIMTGEGKPKHLLPIAGEAVRSLNLDPSQLKEFTADGMKGYTTSQRLNNKIFTFALVQNGSEMVTIVIAEPETLQPLGPQAIPTLKRQ